MMDCFQSCLSILLSYSKKYLEKHDLELKIISSGTYMTIIVLLLKKLSHHPIQKNKWLVSCVRALFLGHMQQSTEGGGLKVMENPPVNGCGGGRVWGLETFVQKPF